MKKMNYEPFEMDIILFGEDAWTLAAVGSGGTDMPIMSKIEQAIANAYNPDNEYGDK
ncbi:MAG: hypothetical protein LUE20_02545 [Oscillospiraceae bacterium]|nr:hypothetical protein [Oscillospiraceae bacterium]